MARTRSRGHVLRGLLVLAWCLAATLEAQETLTLQVVVRDEHRRSVEDLKPEEVQISEDGKPVTVQSFHRVRTEKPELLSILMNSGSSESVALAREDAPELFTGDSGKDLRGSLWDTKQGSLLLNWSSDRKALTEALQSLAQDAVGSRTVSPTLEAVAESARARIREQHSEPWFAVLSALIAEQGSIEGRKEVVFFAPKGEEGSTTEKQIAALGSNAMRAGVSVYIVETGDANAQAEAKASALLTGHKNNAEAGQNEWRELAQKTGGFYLAAPKNNVRDALRRAEEDLSSYYAVTFVGPPQTGDGHFRPIAVKTTRPRTATQYATGYYSVPNVCAFDLAAYEIPLLEAMHSGASGDELNFDSQVLRFGEHDGKTTAAVVVEVPRSTLYNANDDEEKLLKIHFSVYAQIKSADGKVIQRFTEDVPYETAIENAHASPKSLFTFQRSFLLAPGEYSAEVALADQLASNIGRHEMKFSISEPKSPIALGDLVLIRGVDAATTDVDNPLRFASQAIIPWAGDELPLSHGSELPVLLKVYQDPSVPSPPDVRLEILHDKQSMANLPLMLSGGKDGEYQALVWLPESSLQPGHYTFVAHASQAEATVERRRELDIVEPGKTGALSIADNEPDVSAKQLLSPAPDLIAGAKRPSDSEIDVILKAARERALDYKRGLPNFSCLQTTKRFTSKSGPKNWKAKDTITELVRYNSGKEQHEVLEINGNTRDLDPKEIKGLITKGEFGEFLDAIYSPDAHAEFAWQGITLVDGRQSYVFAFKVKRSDSIYSLSTIDGRSRVNSAFQGLIHIDKNTLATRFVSIEAESVPKECLYREANIAVNYAEVTVSGQKFLLPKSAALTTRVGRRLLYKDDMEFRNYRRYGATSTLVSDTSGGTK
ncbi:MAG: VWA domain-containing protein [Bryobacteraceae bacterium]